jgi:hypothetical protein
MSDTTYNFVKPETGVPIKAWTKGVQLEEAAPCSVAERRPIAVHLQVGCYRDRQLTLKSRLCTAIAASRVSRCPERLAGSCSVKTSTNWSSDSRDFTIQAHTPGRNVTVRSLAVGSVSPEINHLGTVCNCV